MAEALQMAEALPMAAALEGAVPMAEALPMAAALPMAEAKGGASPPASAVWQPHTSVSKDASKMALAWLTTRCAVPGRPPYMAEKAS